MPAEHTGLKWNTGVKLNRFEKVAESSPDRASAGDLLLGSWTSGQRLVKPPTHVEIRDAHGDHRVKVESWD
jgi:hypothetical protein